MAIILYINFVYKEVNILYSILMILITLNNSYISESVSFKWSNLYYFVSILILINIFFKMTNFKKMSMLINDKIILNMVLILVFGLISSILSIQVSRSIKKTILTFLAFLLFYVVPSHFFDNNEKRNFLSYLVIPLNIGIILISTINIFNIFNILNIKRYIYFWSTKTALYLNSNTFGSKIGRASCR